MEQNNTVFYRKYRPQKFKEVAGQAHIIEVLEGALQKKHVAHAYLFSGPRGTGKTTTARIFAREVGCTPEDIIEIDAASSRGIDEARALREAVRVLPMRSSYKVYIIDEVHMLTKEAFNALLKTLEEPPEHAIFILATTELDKLPDTIISRTQHFEFRKIAIPDIVRELKRIAAAEKITIDDDALKLIAFFAEGSLRDAENTLYQVLGMEDKKITEQAVRLLLGAPKERAVSDIVALLIKKDVKAALEIFDEIVRQGINPSMLARLFLRNFRAMYLLSFDPSGRLVENEFSKEEIVAQKAMGGERAMLEYAVRELLAALQTRVDDYVASLPLELALIKIGTYEQK